MDYLFLHGLGQTPESWERTIQYLKGCGKEAGRREDADRDAGIGERDVLCAVDLYALFRSRKAEKAEADYETLYAAFSEFCKTREKPFHLCGLSLGGVLCLQYALEHPRKVRSLVLIGTQYRMPRLLFRLQNAVFHLLPERAFFETGLSKREMIRLMQSMRKLDFGKSLKNLDCPALIVCGERDRANKVASDSLSKLLPDAKPELIERAGHEVNKDAPEKLGRILNEFYREL